MAVVSTCCCAPASYPLPNCSHRQKRPEGDSNYLDTDQEQFEDLFNDPPPTSSEAVPFFWSLKGLHPSTKYLIHLVRYSRKCGHEMGTVAYLFNTDQKGDLDVRITVDANPDTQCKVSLMTVVVNVSIFHSLSTDC